MVNGRVVYITGAASGIGLQVGVEFLKKWCESCIYRCK